MSDKPGKMYVTDPPCGFTNAIVVPGRYSVKLPAYVQKIQVTAQLPPIQTDAYCGYCGRRTEDCKCQLDTEETPKDGRFDFSDLVKELEKPPEPPKAPSLPPVEAIPGAMSTGPYGGQTQITPHPCYFCTAQTINRVKGSQQPICTNCTISLFAT